ncbi:hypothetical protein MMC20_006498 [Loxospora ochrophaea]|nr:hypothetical protein [Loxospora ochrophaea]
MGILASECKETKTFWELSAGKCWDRKKVNDWQIAASSFSAAVNLVLALLPAQVIWGLHIKRQAKIRLSFLLGLGLFAFICAAVQVSTLRGLLADPDLFWNTQDVLIWSTTELNIIIWAACFPIARPVWIKAGRAIRGKFSRHPDNGPDNGTDNGLVGPLELETTTTTPAEASITCPPPVAQPSTFGYNHWHPDEECISNEAEVPPNRIKKTVDVQYSYEPRQEEFCAMDIPQNLEVGPESRYAYGPPQEAQSQPFVNPQNLGNKAYS